jgi:signal transduction histidine kinase
MRQKMEAVLPHPGVVVQGTAATTPVRAPFTALQVASVALPFLLAIAFSFWIWRQVEAEAHDTAARTTALLHEHVARALEVQDAIIAAVRARIDGMDWTEIGASEAVVALLTRLDEATPNTNRNGIMDPTGTLVAMSRVPPPGPRTTHTDRDIFTALSAPGPDRAMLGRPVVGRTSGDRVIPYARPHLGPDGRASGGVIWTTFRPDSFADMFQRIALGPADTVLLVRDDGVVLSRYPRSDPTTMQPLAAAPPPMRAVAAAAELSRAQETRTSPAAPGLLGTGAGTAIGPSPADQVERLYVARTLPGPGVAVVYGRAVAELRAEWLRRSLAVLAVAALSCALLLYLTRRSRDATAREIQARDHARIAAEHRATAEAARADAEAMLRQTQRVEMLGQIAAGVVHDFRNTVQTVHAGASLIERAAAQGNLARVREVAEMLRQAATRGGQLTQRLLSFRKTGDGRNSCDPAEVVSATGTLLRATLGPAYRLSLDVHDTLPPRIAGHPAELDSALMNLVINARDAMPAGGEIAIALRPASAAPGLPPGRFMELSVTDDGIGMDAETLSRATEAFFTTKPGGGTGLGLSSIRGFVEGAGGTMHLRSSPGQGTTVTLWLPEAAEPQAQAQPAGGHTAFG